MKTKGYLHEARKRIGEQSPVLSLSLVIILYVNVGRKLFRDAETVYSNNNTYIRNYSIFCIYLRFLKFESHHKGVIRKRLEVHRMFLTEGGQYW
jgi:hypothetical protein